MHVVLCMPRYFFDGKQDKMLLKEKVLDLQKSWALQKLNEQDWELTARDFKHYCCNPHLGNDPEWLPEKRENQYLWGLCQTASELQNMRMRAVETQRHLKRRFWSPLESRIEIWWFWASFCLVSLLLMTARLESNNAIITWAVLKNKHRCPITTISNQTTVTIVTSQSHFKTDSQGKRSDSRH